MPITASATAPASTPSSPPRLLYVDGKPRILATLQSAEHIILQGQGGQAELTGAFAASVSALLDDRTGPDDLQRLGAIEASHPWLHGLHRSHAIADHGLVATALPLGMLFIELTARCNERCIHCYAESGPERTEFLSLHEVRVALTMAAGLGQPFVQFTGGDPLIHPHLVEAVAHARTLDFSGIEIYTNGLLLNEALIAGLRPLTPRICFSIYADTPEIHDAITGVPGSWRKTLAAMHRAQQAGLEIRAGIALMDENVEAAGRMVDFLHRKFALADRHIRFDVVKQTGRGRESQHLQQIHTGEGHAPSEGAAGKLCVAADGSVYPCIFARHTPVGNIRTSTLHAMMRTLSERRPAAPSAARWEFCRASLSCMDCRMNVYALGTEHLEESV